MLILERPRATGRAESDLFTTAFQFQCVARFQLQLLSQGLGDNDPARFVHNETRVHFGMIVWVEPQINTIYLAEKWQLNPLGTKFKEVTP